MPSSRHPDEGWVKFFFDPPYDQPTSIWKTTKYEFARWRKDLAMGRGKDHVTLWTSTMIIYDTRSRPGTNGRIIIAVKT